MTIKCLASLLQNLLGLSETENRYIYIINIRLYQYSHSFMAVSRDYHVRHTIPMVDGDKYFAGITYCAAINK